MDSPLSPPPLSKQICALEHTCILIYALQLYLSLSHTSSTEKRLIVRYFNTIKIIIIIITVVLSGQKKEGCIQWRHARALTGGGGGGGRSAMAPRHEGPPDIVV